MKIAYKRCRDISYVKIIHADYCCDEMKARINPKYITEELLDNMVEKCPQCGELIELINLGEIK